MGICQEILIFKMMQQFFLRNSILKYILTDISTKESPLFMLPSTTGLDSDSEKNKKWKEILIIKYRYIFSSSDFNQDQLD